MAEPSEHHQQVVEQVVAAVTTTTTTTEAEENHQEGEAGKEEVHHQHQHHHPHPHYQPHPPHPPPPAELPPVQQQEGGVQHHHQQPVLPPPQDRTENINVEGVVAALTTHHETVVVGGTVETTTGGEHHHHHHHHPTTPVLTTTAAVSIKKDYEDDEDIGSNALTDSNSKRRFFPRVKHLLTREWAYFLTGILDALDESGACVTAAASHKASNAWYKAFDLVYSGIAVDCSVPTGKNRYHKFKDKIIELWVAMETQAPDDHPLKQRALDQVDAYRKACEEAQLNFKNGEPTTTGGVPKTPGEKKPKSYASSGGTNKRSYGSAMMSSGQGGGGLNKWKYIDEGEAIKKLPEQLQRLLHLRHLSTELKAQANVEITFQKELDEYLKADCPKEDAYDKSLALACLWRQAQSPKEAKEIQSAYEHAVSEYLSYIDPSSATVHL